MDADLRRRSRPDRSARSRSRPAIRTSSTRAAARDCSVPILPSATASTSPPTAARRGPTSVCETASRSPRSPWIPRDPNRLFVAVLGHPYGPNDERGDLPLDRRRRDVPARALHERRTPARSPSRSTRAIPTRSMRRCGRRGRRRGNRRFVRDSGQRRLQVDRRRHDVDAAQPRASRRGSDGRTSRRAERSGASCTSTPTTRRAKAAPSIAATTPARTSSR